MAAVDPGRCVIEPAVTFFGETAMEKYFDLHGADFTIRCKIYFAPVAKPAAGIETGLEEDGQPFRHVIVFCHGFAGHKDNAMAQKLAGRILEKHDDTALVIFNWPAMEMTITPGSLWRTVTPIWALFWNMSAAHSIPGSSTPAPPASAAIWC